MKPLPQRKVLGTVYTPECLAGFLASVTLGAAAMPTQGHGIRVLDPALGHGELVAALLDLLPEDVRSVTVVHGFDPDTQALEVAGQRLRSRYPSVQLRLEARDFLEFAASRSEGEGTCDLVVANPPYVRTQILGSRRVRHLTETFGLGGRLDLSHAFLVAITRVLSPEGTAGVIVSNRFMTTASGAAVRRALLGHTNVLGIWDLGDTEIFDAAILPAVIVLGGPARERKEPPVFTSIYRTDEGPGQPVGDPLSALRCRGIVSLPDGRSFRVRHGHLVTDDGPDAIWRVGTEEDEKWLNRIRDRTWAVLGDIGRIHVGVKTCADRIFIRDDWQEMPDAERPELLKPLTTHRNARCYRPVRVDPPWMVVYPHTKVSGTCGPVDLSRYPRTAAYLEAHRSALEKRRYLADAGRRWYELWVPHDPDAWSLPKLVFRDIARTPTFWVDLEGTVVNGDCYWMTIRDPDLLWLAAGVANSTLVARYYDVRFANRLYSGRRRFMARYVKTFPLPDPAETDGRAIIELSKEIYERMDYGNRRTALERELVQRVWRSLTGADPAP